MARAEPAGTRRGPLYRRAPHARDRHHRRRPRQEGDHDDHRSGRRAGPDLLDRDFVASAPNRCWGADFTHVATWNGVVHVAFVMDTFSRRIVGRSASTTKGTRLVLDALEMALWQRDRDGVTAMVLPRRRRGCNVSREPSQEGSSRQGEDCVRHFPASTLGCLRRSCRIDTSHDNRNSTGRRYRGRQGREHTTQHLEGGRGTHGQWQPDPQVRGIHRESRHRGAKRRDVRRRC
ncbi:DDE-type integrase/transposase/recombinase [Streptomyces sp. NPDC006510]|uniref:DDE-type integrase/transposase/recombinase n=1 Tax=Streptomyces sp. NPDC006510 TaxID=3155600 RepID=UPI0033A821F1